ncbi:DUF2339 domain-containing protein [Croceicoccus naphthovorans]|uniref:Uncharacterized protein n=1 Tax=Croceicoccus naphthovorans TaxID=1348774 RepID=A0A0G3XF27_9SPHN|nr:DUF2339 domain-containing protein [Croceicoccus naphthovorans]AKM09204.1 hypothetical protein AB433_03240 [Croceicoccus naphthovorans]MBB3990413.1 putative membrane protein [Croceicoccus naphthovorans]
MEWIVIIGMGVALYQLWRRLEQLERTVAWHEQRLAAPVADPAPFAPEPAVPEPVPDPAPRPARSVASVVPQVRKIARAVVSDGSVAQPRATSVPRSFSFNFEDLFGRQLPIWAGGITLAIAGFFLVMYAIDLGLLSPLVRVLLGFAFGALLLNGAFFAERMKARIADDRVPQALAGAGLATLYACFYLAGTQYGLIGSGIAFAGLAAVTAGAIWLSFRFGLPSAILGLVGGFAAPMMVSTDQANLPVLSIYLALVSGGLVLTGNRQQRPWLGMAALAGGILWGFAMLYAQDFGAADRLFVGLYVIGIGAALPAMLGDVPHRRWLRAGAGAFAALQMAEIVDEGGFEMLTWGLYAVLAGALSFLAWRESELRDARALAAAVLLWLLIDWYNPDAAVFAGVAFVFATIFAAVPLAHIWRGDARHADIVQLAGFAPLLTLTTMWHFGAMFNDLKLLVGAAALVLAALPAVAAWRLGEESLDWRGHLLEFSAALTTFFAFAQVLHDDWGAIAMAISAIGFAVVLPRRVATARTFAAMATLFAIYPLAEWWEAGLNAMATEPFYKSDLVSWQDTLRYLVPGVAAGLVLAWRQAGIGSKYVTRGIAVAAGIGALVAVHSLYKLVFGIIGPVGFEALGLAERTVWEALLLGAAMAAVWAGDRLPHGRRIAMDLAGTSLAHFAVFTLLMHNPLWSAQAVGPVVVANLGLAAYAVPVGALALLSRLVPAKWRDVFEVGIMALLPILAITLLRQAFSGTILIDTPLGQAEDLLRSLAGILLAVGYLLWGARTGDRTWRIGSLVLMLLAVGKVFVLDASVLEGLARIASFLALGFSLIGIGWFYSRILSRPQPAQAAG